MGEAADGIPDDPTWPERLVDVLFLLREHTAFLPSWRHHWQ
jgi:hypothetical protein